MYNNFIFTVFPLQDITPYIHGKLNTSGLIDLIEIKGCQWLTQGLSILEMKADSELAITFTRSTGITLVC